MQPTKKAIGQDPYTTYIGHAVEDIEAESTLLKVACPELMPLAAQGSIGAGITQGTVSLTNRDGKPVSSTFTTSNHLVATWEGETNRRVPPMVRQGEPVEVYRTQNQDKFFWRVKGGQGRDFRTTDRHHLEVAASDPTKPGTTKDDTNTYSAYVDAVAQKIGVKSSQANKEAMAFTMEADLKNGFFYASDNPTDPDSIGNRIFMDTGAVSGTPKFQVNLQTGITFTLEGENAFLSIPKSLQIKAGERIVIDSPIMVFNLEQQGTVFLNAASFAINAAKDVVVTAGSVIGLNASSTKIGGVLISAAARITTAVRGALGSLYHPATIQHPEDSPVTDASNTADTDVSGPPYQ